VPEPLVTPPATDYRKLLTVLASRAARLGSRDPEAAAQEAVRRTLASAKSRPAMEFYFHERESDLTPEWSLVQLLAWLHGVLRFVVREERARAGAQREQLAAGDDFPDPMDPSPSQLDQLIGHEQRTIVQECLAELNADHRKALSLRLQGENYAAIAVRLGTNINTVATWLRRGSLELVEQVRARLDGPSRRHGLTAVCNEEPHV
jgi:RNA polymerase sigma factor (sigma-70 family)